IWIPAYAGMSGSNSPHPPPHQHQHAAPGHRDAKDSKGPPRAEQFGEIVQAIKASVRPTSATCACAMTLAVALPPTRGCKITIELQKTIGNTANIPEANEPMLLLAVVTITTTVAAASARSGMS